MTLTRLAWRDAGLATIAVVALGVFVLLLLSGTSWGVLGAVIIIGGMCAAAAIVVGSDAGPRAAFVTGAGIILVIGGLLFGRFIGGRMAPWYLAAALSTGSIGASVTACLRVRAGRRARTGLPVDSERMVVWASVAVVALSVAAVPLALSPLLQASLRGLTTVRRTIGWKSVTDFWLGVGDGGTLDDRYAQGLSFGVDPRTGRVTGVSGTILVKPGTGAKTYWTYAYGDASNLQAGAPVEAAAGGRVFLDASVPLAKVLPELEAFSRSVLSGTATDPVSADCVVTNENGYVYGRIGQVPVYLGAGGSFQRVDAGMLVVATGHVVQIWAGGNIYLLQSLSDPLEIVQTDTVEPGLPDGTEIMQVRVADMTGDSVRERVYLLGSRSSPGLEYPDNRWLRIVDGKAIADAGLQAATGTDYPLSEHVWELGLRDLDQDGRAEILLRSMLGDNGVVCELDVHSLNRGRLSPLFRASQHHTLPGLSNEYIGNGQARTSVTSLKMVWEWPIYQGGLLLGNDPTLSERFKPDQVGPLAGYDLADLDDDGTIEIIGRQPIRGLFEDMEIASLRQVFAWDGRAFVLTDIQLYNRDGSLMPHKAP